MVGNQNVRGKGIGEQMIREVLKIAFGDLQLHKVSLGVFEFNQSAIVCYVKVGFKKRRFIKGF